MNPAELETFAQANLALQGYVLDEAARRAVLENFLRIATIAQALDAVVLHPEDEPANVFSAGGVR